MEKAFGIFILFIAVGAFVYLLPQVGEVFGFNGQTTANTAVMWLSLDNGRSFNGAFWHSALTPEILDIKRSPADANIVYAGTTNGLFISKDGGLNWYQWSDLEKTIDSQTIVYRVVINQNNPDQVFLSAFRDGRGRIYETQDNFFTLNLIWDTAAEAVYDMELLSNILYLGLSDGRLFSYSLINREFRPMASFGSAIADVDVANGNIYVATKQQGLFISYNGGQSFVASADDLASKSGGRLNAIAVQQRSSAALYAASLSGVFESFNQGSTWKPIDTLVSNRQSVDVVALGSGDDLYIGAGNKLYASQDGGSNWQLILNLSNTSKKVSSFYSDSSGKIMVGTK